MEKVVNKEQESSQGKVLFIILSVIFVASLTVGLLMAAKVI